MPYSAVKYLPPFYFLLLCIFAKKILPVLDQTNIITERTLQILIFFLKKITEQSYLNIPGHTWKVIAP